MEREKPEPVKPEDVYGLTEKERLYYRVPDARFQEILDDEQTAIHDVQISTNNYSEFLFVHTSRPGGEGRKCVTFYGLGLHELRKRWITDEWFYYRWNPPPQSQVLEQTLSREQVRENIRQRRDELAHYGTPDAQSSHGWFYEMLADLTDDDAALTELEDLGFDDDLSI